MLCTSSGSISRRKHTICEKNTNSQQGSSLTCPPTSCNRAVLTGSCSMSVLMAVWSNGQALRCSLFRHILQTVCPQPRLMGRRIVSSNVWVQIGHSRNSVHCGACTGMVYVVMGHVCVCVSVNLSFDKDKTNTIYLYMEDSTGIKISFFRTQLFLNVFTHCGFGITSRDECWKRKKRNIRIDDVNTFKTKLNKCCFTHITNLFFKSIMKH